MPNIPDAFTDAKPAAAVYHGRLYVAYKDSNSQNIWLASTDNPEDSSSWVRTELTMSFSGLGPGMIRTATGPALSVIGNSLWIAFKGHNNNLVWLVSMNNGRYRGHGYVPDVQTAETPSFAGPLLVHRGADDQRIWYKGIATPGTDNRIPHESASTYATPAVAYMSSNLPMVVFRSALNNDIMFTQTVRRGNRSEWTVPDRVLDATSRDAPALAVHDGTIFLGYRTTSNQVRIASYGPHPWTYHNVAPGFYAGSPALISFDGRFYIVARWHEGNQLWCWEVETERYHYAVQIGYRPNPNGFRFVNFSEGAPDWDTFRDTFGHGEVDAAAAASFFDKFFAMFTGGLYALLFDSFYAVYLRFTDGRLNTGMCSAYAAASLRRYWEGTTPPCYREFRNAASAAALPEGIRRELTVDFGRLLGGEILTDLLGQCEAGQANVEHTLNTVHRDLEGGSGLNTGRIVFFVPAGRIWDAGFLDDLRTTHAVVPYRIEYPVTSDGGPIRMYVYDCNHPGNNSSSRPNGYSYIEFTDDGHGGYTFVFFTGDSSSSASNLSSANGFTLASMTLHDYLFRDISLPLRLNFVVDMLNCPAELRISNGKGKITGRKGGKIHWEIPGSYPLYPSANGFLLPRGNFSREIHGTGDGEYTFYSWNPDGSGVMVHGLARGGRNPSRDMVTIDRAKRMISVRSNSGVQRCSLGISKIVGGRLRLVSLTDIAIKEKVPFSLTYSDKLENMRATYNGPSLDIFAEVFHAKGSTESARKVRAPLKLKTGKLLQLNLKFGKTLSIGKLDAE